ncbi:DUF503 domain-containing protein [Gottschalkiaceae bacterium SANA]|nr:DUF503 domain-containing protein [Gottschalkiaceae bacterium SANA]
MFVKSNKIEIRIFDSFSLKDKRSVVKSIVAKTHRKFNVSISEVEDYDLLNKTTLGIAIVSNNNQLNQQIFNRIIRFIEDNYQAEIISIENYE